MKTLLFAAALMVGGAAYAQDTSGQAGTGGTGMGGQTVAPGNQAPERDARGIPVVSAPAEAPAGYNQPPSVNPTPPATTMSAPAGPLPPCTRKVTDHCTQTYERHHGGSGAAMSGGSGDSGMAADSSGGDMGATTTTTTTKKTTTQRRTRRK